MSGSAKPGSSNRSGEFRPDDDHYPTPRAAVYPLVRAQVIPSRSIWEPACGEGHISAVLNEFGYRVVSTNLADRGFGQTGVDFLRTRKLRAPCIVSNPPFKIVDDFVAHALSFKPRFMALLLRTKFLEGERRYRRIHRPHPPSLVLQFIDRVKFFAGDTPTSDQPGWNTEAFAWFCWARHHVGDTRVRWVEQQEGTNHELFGEVA